MSRMFTILTINVCFLLFTAKWNIVNNFFFTEHNDSLQLRFVYFCLFWIARFILLQRLFRNVCLKRFPKPSLSSSPSGSTQIFDHHGQIGEQSFYTPKFRKFYIDFENRC